MCTTSKRCLDIETVRMKLLQPTISWLAISFIGVFVKRHFLLLCGVDLILTVVCMFMFLPFWSVQQIQYPVIDANNVFKHNKHNITKAWHIPPFENGNFNRNCCKRLLFQFQKKKNKNTKKKRHTDRIFENQVTDEHWNIEIGLVNLNQIGFLFLKSDFPSNFQVKALQKNFSFVVVAAAGAGAVVVVDDVRINDDKEITSYMNIQYVLCVPGIAFSMVDGVWYCTIRTQ